MPGPCATPPAFSVRVEPLGRSFPASGDLPLRVSAAQAGIVLPTSCRNGTCRACLCRALEGQVVYRIDWPGVSADERTEGWLLPCVAHPASDLVLEAPAAR